MQPVLNRLQGSTSDKDGVSSQPELNRQSSSSSGTGRSAGRTLRLPPRLLVRSRSTEQNIASHKAHRRRRPLSGETRMGHPRSATAGNFVDADSWTHDLKSRSPPALRSRGAPSSSSSTSIVNSAQGGSSRSCSAATSWWFLSGDALRISGVRGCRLHGEDQQVRLRLAPGARLASGARG